MTDRYHNEPHDVPEEEILLIDSDSYPFVIAIDIKGELYMNSRYCSTHAMKILGDCTQYIAEQALEGNDACVLRHCRNHPKDCPGHHD